MSTEEETVTNGESGAPGASQQPLAGGVAVEAISSSGLVVRLRLSFELLWKVFTALTRQGPVPALDVASAGRERLGSRHGLWVTTLASVALIGALVQTGILKSVANGVSGILSDLTDSLTFGLGGDAVSDSMSIGFGRLVGLTLMGFLILLVPLVLRALTVKWTLAMRGSRVSYADAATMVATASVIYLAPLTVALVCTWLPLGAMTLLLALLSLVLLVPLIVSEITLYVALNRHAQLGRSPLMPHAWMTLAWVVMSGIGMGLVSLVLGGIL